MPAAEFLCIAERPNANYRLSLALAGCPVLVESSYFHRHGTVRLGGQPEVRHFAIGIQGTDPVSRQWHLCWDSEAFRSGPLRHGSRAAGHENVLIDIEAQANIHKNGCTVPDGPTCHGSYGPTPSDHSGSRASTANWYWAVVPPLEFEARRDQKILLR